MVGSKKEEGKMRTENLFWQTQSAAISVRGEERGEKTSAMRERKNEGRSYYLLGTSS